MHELVFPPEAMEALGQERLHHPHPRVQLKMAALYVQSQGLPGEEIPRLCALSQAPYDRDLQEYGPGGRAHLKALTVAPRESDLQA